MRKVLVFVTLLSGTVAFLVSCPNPAGTLPPGGKLPQGTRVITAFAGNGELAVASSLGMPMGVAFVSGNVIIAAVNDNMIREVDSRGKIYPFAGNGVRGYSGDDGGPVDAELGFPTAVVADGSGDIFIADSRNNRIREVVAGGVIRTVAGDGTAGYAGDKGLATAAELNHPQDVAVDSAGDIFIADTGNNVIRKVSGGTIITYAGKGTAGFSGDGFSAAVAELSAPTGVVFDDATGNLFIADSGNNRIRKETPPVGSGPAPDAGIISTYAGNGTAGYSGDGGAATDAELNGPSRVTMDSAGTLYISDAKNGAIRTVTQTSAKPAIATFVGNGALGQPAGLALAGSHLFVADASNERVLDVNGGTIRTIAGNGMGAFPGDSFPAQSAELWNPVFIATDSAGNVYISDVNENRVRMVDKFGTITTVAGNGVKGYGGDGGLATSASLDNPYQIAVDAAGNIYVADAGNHRVRKFTVSGVITTVAGKGTSGNTGDGGLAIDAEFVSPEGVAVDGSGDIFVADSASNCVREVVASTENIRTVAGTSGNLSSPMGVVVDGSGNLYIADCGNSAIRKVDPSGTMTTVAGNGTSGFSGDGGSPAASAVLSFPMGLAMDGAGNLYVADEGNSRIRAVNLAAGTITTVAGSGTAGDSGDNGDATKAQLGEPTGVAVDGAGNLYIVDLQAQRVRKVSP
ncbi:MAG TPA: hypothetical protein VMM82_08965 [Spirochaetia bacterium]|nr:hypothetical protein [Spirochaetia bacterium]